MRHALALTACLVLTVAAAPDQSRPDFSGTWQIDVARSAKAGADRPDTWIVTQAGDTLTIADARFPDDTRAYKLDGSPTESFHILTGRWVYRTLWIGDRLMISSEGEDPAAASREIWSLDHGALVIEWQRAPARARTLINRYKRIR